MSDIRVTHSSEFMLVNVLALSDDGENFIDAWTPTRKGAEFHVPGSRRLVLNTRDMDNFVNTARQAGLSIERIYD